MRKFRTVDGVERGFVIDGEDIDFHNGTFIAKTESIAKLVKKIPPDYPIKDHRGKIVNSKKEDSHDKKKTKPVNTIVGD